MGAANLKLLLLSTEFPPGPGGIGNHASQIAAQLARRGWQIVVVTPQAYAEDEEIEAFNAAQPYRVVGLRPLRRRPLRVLDRLRTVARWVAELRPDVLLASGDPAVYLAAWIASRRRLPWAAVEHGRIPPRHERWLKRRSFAAASEVVAVSAYSLRRLLELGVEPRAQRVIHNGADAERFLALPVARVEELRGRLGFGEAPLLLSVGNVTERKGQDIVIRALPRILEKCPGARYLIAGLPTRGREFEALAERLGVQRHVRFLGRVDAEDLPGLYNCCDVFVMTSRHTAEEFEGFGIAVVEAALCGKPAIVTADSGLAEAIADGETGFEVPIDDPDATAEAIVSLLADEERRLLVGAQARRRALAAQTWERKAGEYDEVLSGIAVRAVGG